MSYRHDKQEEIEELQKFVLTHWVINRKYQMHRLVDDELIRVKIDLVHDLIEMFPEEAKNSKYKGVGRVQTHIWAVEALKNCKRVQLCVGN